MNRASLVLAPLAIALAACSQPADTRRASDDTVASATSSVGPTAPAPAATSAANALTWAGLGDLEIGKPVPPDSRFKLRGAQASDSCLVYSSPAYPGAYAMIEDGTLRRITITRDSRLKLAEGIGIGATEKEVLAAFPGFVAEPHQYVPAPGKYLTQPGGDPRLRFEIGEDGRVTDIHVGLVPQLLYVEGCA